MRPTDLVKILKQEYGLNIRPSQLHLWEDYDLIGKIARSDQGYRMYSDWNVEDVKKVAVLKALGMDNTKIKAIMEGNEHIKRELLSQIEAYETSIIPKGKELGK